jgi:aryl-alcohol dehydrogenase-like predicted oxidoreductase
VAKIGRIAGASGLALGGNVFGWTADEKESFAVLDRYVDSGGNLLDSADAYYMWAEGLSGGESETILGRWLASRQNRDRVIIVTKVGMWDQRPGLGADNIRSAVEDSLRRLHTEYIDVYFAHKDDPTTPQEETLAVFTELVKEGKVREIGASNFSADRLASAMEVSDAEGFSRFVAIEAPYNLMQRELYEQTLSNWARNAGVAVLPYYGLAQGFLTGKYRAAGQAGESARAPKALRYLDDRGLRVLSALDSVAASHGVSLAAIALAWLRARPEVVAPLASARTPRQLEQLLACLDVVLSESELAMLDAASQKGTEQFRR